MIDRNLPYRFLCGQPLNFLPSGERLSSVEDAEELFLDFRLTVSAIQHCQVGSKNTHVYSDILPDSVSRGVELPETCDVINDMVATHAAILDFTKN